VADDDILDDVVAGLRSFLQATVVARHEELAQQMSGRHYDATGRLSEEIQLAYRQVREASASAGYYTLLTPAELGGGGLGFEALLRVWETLFEFCGAEYWLGHQAIAHWSRGPSHLYALLESSFRDEVLPGLLSGTDTTSIAISEPDAGSDLWRMSTRATRTEGGWLIDGTKQWSTNAPYARWILVFAASDREAFASHKGGITGFVVDMGASGVNVDSVIAMFGHLGGDEGIVSFRDCFVPDRQVLGEPGQGLSYALSGVSAGRLYNAARAIGTARWATRRALAYAEHRVTFGRPLIENQAISFPLADSATSISAAHLLSLAAARRLDAGDDARSELAMAKSFATEMAVKAVDHSIQVHGAMGFTNEVYLVDGWHSVRRALVADGTAEMMRRQIVTALRRDGLPS
jgi:acyl-CoA dehydrogenase